MAAVGCDSGGDGGGNDPNNPNNGGGSGGIFTLTGIPSQYNGKYAELQGGTYESESFMLMGLQSVNMATGSGTLVQISGGSVSLPMWRINMNSNGDPVGNPVRYSGNSTGGEYFVGIHNTLTVNAGSYSPIAVIGFENIPFTNGSATRTWSQGIGY